MYEFLACIAYEHNPLYTLLALIVCIAGSVGSMRLFARVRRTTNLVRVAWLFISGIVIGGTIWSTHFIAMLGFESPVTIGYSVASTVASLFLAVGIATAGLYVASISRTSWLIEVGGAIVGLSIVVMHFTGMASLQLHGYIEWKPGYVVFSIIAGIFFGAVSTNRIARPLTTFCKYGGAAGLTLAIVLLHYIAMSAVTIVPASSDAEINGIIPSSILAGVVFGVMVLIFCIAMAIYVIDHKQSESNAMRFKHLALHDPLTKLPNRAAVEQFLSESIANPIDDTAKLVVTIFDLDRFKTINDVYGHAAGDQVLRNLAARLTDSLGPDEYVGRIGGDEFMGIKTAAYSHYDAEQFCKRLLQVAEPPMEWEGRPIEISVNIGACRSPDDGKTAAELQQRADLALYRAKASGMGPYVFYDTDMDDIGRERSALSIDLRSAVERQELFLVYQRQNDIESGAVVGVEALMRWRHPTRGLISPSEFIPIAEETNLIMDLGEWALRTACRDAAAWAQDWSVSVNISAAQLALPNLPEVVRDALTKSGLSPSRLELEITESGIISDQSHALSMICELKKLGVKIAMDDYGTGFSSLSTLKTFPFDKVKIDREFVKDLPDNRQSMAIIEASIILGHGLGMTILAEGAESEEQVAYLREKKCSLVQGFFYGKPLLADEIRALALAAPDRQSNEIAA